MLDTDLQINLAKCLMRTGKRQKQNHFLNLPTELNQQRNGENISHPSTAAIYVSLEKGELSTDSVVGFEWIP